MKQGTDRGFELIKKSRRREMTGAGIPHTILLNSLRNRLMIRFSKREM